MHGTKGYYGKWEAHHILSVSCVNRYPEDSEVRKTMELVLPETDWCINAKRNMLAMPKFGHTIMYYTDVRADKYYEVDFDPPPFANIPQHDFEHNTELGYCHEVLTELNDLWDSLQSAKASGAHPDAAAEWLVGELNQLSSDFRTKLRDRGKRQGGTHNAWKKAIEGDNPKWYLPFSMATAAHAADRYHPMSGARGRRSWAEMVNEKMEKIRSSMSAAGAL
jgi:hypothetical protein